MNALIVLTDIVEKIILLLLLGLSVWSVSIILDRKKVFKTESLFDFHSLKKMLDEKNFEAAKKACDAQGGFIGLGMAQALKHKSSLSIEKSVSSFTKEEKKRLEKGMTVLATLGANAPFIGLFGTVLGIIRSFAYLGSQSGSSAVMSGVSQALYATAVGLFVAIPAVVAYNVFSKKLKDLILNLESLRDLYISQINND